MSQQNACLDSAALVTVRAPCRLHFGLFSFGQPAGPQFGGVGAMVEPPAIEVTVRAADEFAVSGTLADRAETFARTIAERWQLESLPNCHLEISSPPDHTGLGVGTQLALSVAAALRRFLRLPDLTVEALATSIGRGMRSAIGTHGFQHGGLIVDLGKQSGQLLGTLARRIELPSAWRFVLVRAAQNRGLAGDSELAAFDRLPPVPTSATQHLWRITNDAMLPAIERNDCAAFGESVYQFGVTAGGCFATVQNGPFANAAIAQLVDSIRAYGVPGVGQSSWGPTVFAIVPNEPQAEALADWLRESGQAAANDLVIAQPNNTGAQISTL